MLITRTKPEGVGACTGCGEAFLEGQSAYAFPSMEGFPYYCERCFHNALFPAREWSEMALERDRASKESRDRRGWLRR